MEFDQTLTKTDIMQIFNCSPWHAHTFLATYGVRISSRRLVIGLRRVRQLQASGEAAEFFRRPPKKEAKA